MDSILTSIKKLLGMTEDYVVFDSDIIMCINSVFSILRQLGVGPEEGFVVQDKEDMWSDFLEDYPSNFELVKSYTHLKVKLLFDPPANSALIEAMQSQLSELEWRILVEASSLGGDG